jgi:hypothetical protein
MAGALLVAFDALVFFSFLIVAMLAQELLACCSFAWARPVPATASHRLSDGVKAKLKLLACLLRA